MTYIDKINQFWQTQRIARLSPNEAILYLFLLNESYIRMWENPFECSNGLICVSINVSEKTLIDVRNRLQQKGFISFKAGKRKEKSPVYTLLYCNSVSINVSKKVGINVSKNPNLYNSINTINNKKESKEKSKLDFPFSSNLFFEKWNLLLNTPKWKKKIKATLQLALNKLKDFDEEFVIELIDQAIIGEWQGIVFPDTKSKYENWLKQKGGNNEKEKQSAKGYNSFDSTDRKSEIMRRASKAVANSNSKN